MNSHAKWLRQAADEIRDEGHAGWGNTCEQGADEIERLTAEVTRLSEAMKESHTLVPTTWLDELLSGPNKLPFDGDGWQLEAILRAVKVRIERHTIATLSGRKEQNDG